MAEQTVSVVFAPVLSSSSKVIEVTNDFVKAIEAGEKLVLKGTATEEAVLCMSNKTFALKRVEQSNAVFLFNAQQDAQRYAMHSEVKDFFEIIPTVGKTKSVESLLLQKALESASYAATVAYLQENVMASDAEIDEALRRCRAVDDDGRLVTISFTQVVETFEVLFPAVLRHDLSLAALSEATLATHLADRTTRAMLHFILREIGASSVGTEDGDVVWTITDEQAALCLAHVAFLRATTLSWEDIQQEIAARHPSATFSAAALSQSLLQGVAVALSSAASATASLQMFRYYPASATPTELSRCMQDLFAMKKEYTAAELDPYLARYLPYGTSEAQRTTKMTELLLQVARRLDSGLYRLVESPTWK
eukprot:gene7286-5239_t